MSNLLSKASILLTPTATSDGKLHNIKPNTTTGDFTFTRGTVATRVNSNGLIESVASGLPRIDFTGGIGQVLLEPASTNTVTNSDPSSLSDIPAKTGITVETFTWPIGFLQNAIRFPGGTATATNKEGSQATGVDISVSCFVIMDDGSEPKVGGNFSESGVVQDFSLRANNIVVEKNTVKIVNLGNNVYRVSGVLTASRNSGPQNNSGVLQNSNYSGKAFRIGGMQIEQQSFATSYIPTSGTATTRNKDEANSSGDTSLINSTEGVLYGELASFTNSGEPERNISLSNLTVNNTAEIGYSSGTNLARFRLRANNVTILAQNSAVSDTTQFIKIAIKYKSGEIKCFVNGSQVISDTSSFTFSESLSELAFDRGNGSNEFNGKVKCIAVFKEALTDAQLISLTS